jgi:hypothetical protein
VRRRPVYRYADAAVDVRGVCAGHFDARFARLWRVSRMHEWKVGSVEWHRRL